MRPTFVSLAVVLLLALVVPAASQPSAHHRSGASSLGVSLLRPNFAGSNSGASGFTLTLEGYFRLREQLALVTELPFMQGTVSVDALNYSESQVSLGNPYLGLQFGSLEAPVYGDIGVRLPFANDQRPIATDIASLTDLPGFSAYTPNAMELSAGLNVERELATAFWLLGRIGPAGVFDTRAHGSTNLYARYDVMFEIRANETSIALGYDALSLLSEDHIGDRTIDMAVGRVAYRFEKAELNAAVKYPLDESYRRVLNLTYGAGFRVLL
jgi:hypothetical protein